MFKGKNVLVTGGTGMIGTELCKLLIKLSANITIASLDRNQKIFGTKFFQKMD